MEEIGDPNAICRLCLEDLTQFSEYYEIDDSLSEMIQSLTTISVIYENFVCLCLEISFIFIIFLLISAEISIILQFYSFYIKFITSSLLFYRFMTMKIYQSACVQIVSIFSTLLMSRSWFG